MVSFRREKHDHRIVLKEVFDVPTPTVVELKPFGARESVKAKWRASIKRAKNGVAMVSDKSTDPLIHLDPSTAGRAFFENLHFLAQNFGFVVPENMHFWQFFF